VTSPYLEEIRRLDPVRDHQRIVYLDLAYEFPFDTTRSLELAFFRTFAVPTIARTLHASGEFTQRAQKRYDDTDLLISSFVEEGYDSERGKAAIRRVNRIHGRFPIANEDFLYVLSSMVLEPIRWNERFGRRPLVEQERLATFHLWREIGRRMGIKEIPSEYAELERYNVEYERERFAFTQEGREVADAMMTMFVRWFPGLPVSAGRRAITAMLDDALLDALHYPRPPRALRAAVTGSLRLRGRATRVLPPRRRPRIRTSMPHRSYPRGWQVEELGPAP
jgi:hypothetical protein